MRCNPNSDPMSQNTSPQSTRCCVTLERDVTRSITGRDPGVSLWQTLQAGQTETISELMFRLVRFGNAANVIALRRYGIIEPYKDLTRLHCSPKANKSNWLLFSSNHLLLFVFTQTSLISKGKRH